MQNHKLVLVLSLAYLSPSCREASVDQFTTKQLLNGTREIANGIQKYVETDKKLPDDLEDIRPHIGRDFWRAAESGEIKISWKQDYDQERKSYDPPGQFVRLLVSMEYKSKKISELYSIDLSDGGIKNRF